MKLPALSTSRLSLRSLISASLYLLLLLVVCEEFWRLRGAYYGALKHVVRKPENLLEHRRASGCEFDHGLPGWDDLLNDVSRRVPDSSEILFLPLSPDAPNPDGAYCFLLFELFPRHIIRISPSEERPINSEYLTSIAESHGARYVILYRGNNNYNPPFAHCRFGADLFLVDLQNEISCKHVVN